MGERLMVPVITHISGEKLRKEERGTRKTGRWVDRE